MNANERIRLYIKRKKIRVHAFELSIGKANGYLSNTVSPTVGVLENISSIYPDLNIEWVVTGKGSMLNQDKIDKDSIKTKISGDVSGGIFGNNVKSGNINGNGNTIGITHPDCERELIKVQCELDFLKKENKSLKEQLKQAIADKDKAISMFEQYLKK